MKGQDIIRCTKCDSNKVQVVPMKVALFLTGGCLIWVPVIGWIAAPIAWIVMFVLMFTKGHLFRCAECKHAWNVDKGTYKEYKNKLYGKKK